MNKGEESKNNEAVTSQQNMEEELKDIYMAKDHSHNSFLINCSYDEELGRIKSDDAGEYDIKMNVMK